MKETSGQGFQVRLDDFEFSNPHEKCRCARFIVEQRTNHCSYIYMVFATKNLFCGIRNRHRIQYDFYSNIRLRKVCKSKEVYKKDNVIDQINIYDCLHSGAFSPFLAGY